MKKKLTSPKLIIIEFEKSSGIMFIIYSLFTIVEVNLSGTKTEDFNFEIVQPHWLCNL